MESRDVNDMLYHYRFTVERVLDGDTVEGLIDLGFSIFQRIRLRLYGINAPENTGPTREAGKESAAYLATLVQNLGVPVKNGIGRLVVETIKDKDDKYGRTLAILFAGDAEINRMMVAGRHAQAMPGSRYDSPDEA